MDPTPYIATIKHLYSDSNGPNTSVEPIYRTLSGTFGDGNIQFSLPKEGDCIHGSAKFLCVFCEKWYGVKPTTALSTPSCLEKMGQTSSLLVSGNATSETHSASLKPSLEGLFQTSPSETKSDGRHTQPVQREPSFRLR